MIVNILYNSNKSQFHQPPQLNSWNDQNPPNAIENKIKIKLILYKYLILNFKKFKLIIQTKINKK